MEKNVTPAPRPSEDFGFAQSPIEGHFHDHDEDAELGGFGGVFTDGEYGYGDEYEAFDEDEEDEEEKETDGHDEKAEEQKLDERLNSAVQHILQDSNAKYALENTEGCQRFVDDYQDVLGETAGSKGNILHRLIYNLTSMRSGQHKPLETAVAMIVQRYPKLLEMYESPDHKDTPLYAAILKSQPGMVLALMRGFKSSNSSPDLLRDVLGIRMKGESTCLHIAFEKSLDERAIQAMLEFADDAVLAAQNSNGLTPLHLAVNFEDCSDARRETIFQMLRMANRALSIRSRSKLSVYQYHIKTRTIKHAEARDELTRLRPEPKGLLPRNTSSEVSQENHQVQNSGAVSSPQRASFATDVREHSRGRNSRSQGRKGPPVMLEAETETYRPLIPESGMDAPPGRTSEHGFASGKNTNEMNEGRIRFDPRQRDGIRHGGFWHGIEYSQGAHQRNHFRARTVHSSSSNAPIDVRKFREMDAHDTADESALEQKDNFLKEKGVRQQIQSIHGPAQVFPGPGAGGGGMTAIESEKACQKLQRRLKQRRTASEKVKRGIKLECMRKLSPKATSNILYGNNPRDYQISLDFSTPVNGRFRAFESSFDSFEFDDILQYVYLPTVRWTKNESGRDTKDYGDEERGRGRNDVVRIFQWLREKKKVSRVVKVIVEDHEKPAHSDSAIVEALSDLHVEVLHWLKTDLDPATILRVGDDIREVRLRWSGNNTALRAWGDPYGLRRLKQLEKVYLDLVQEENLEDYKTTNANVATFQKRMNQAADLEVDENKLDTDTQRPLKPSPGKRIISIELLRPTFSGRSPDRNNTSFPGTSIPNTENHRWLDTMQAFGKKMVKVWETAKALAEKRRKEASQTSNRSTPGQYINQRPAETIDPVVVALIDDGADILQLISNVGDVQWTGKSLSYGQIGYNDSPTDQRNHSFAESTNGHGTVMAHMIYQVCPMVKLYVIRMEHKRSENGMEAAVDPESAAAAVMAAVKQNVNIISMSWTVSKNSSPNLQRAIEEAQAAKILMFASSSDGGHFSDDAWPVGINRDWFFRIGAATAEGTPFKWAGSTKDLDYILPGVDVAKENPKTKPAKGAKYGETLAEMSLETGSSVATALAAGTAAMLLTCVKMAVWKGKAKASVIVQLQKRERMGAMLDRVGKTPNKFLTVWDTFDTKTWERFADSPDADKMDMVIERILSLIPQAAFDDK
ncbi:hypothetical protein PG993_000029 [Apiospora rasikravindrae]|uniref:Peptidase S8/S53 domain-containing protein n=1 Tax=Apiospora rasikravindrae TaxID=990691 RepID=A0ABR1U7W1_9PEZI